MTSDIFATGFNDRRYNVCGLLGRRWMPHLVVALSQGPQRYGELFGQVRGITQRVMGDRLRELQEAGLVERQVREGGRVSVYMLTGEGRLLLEPVAKGIIEATEPTMAG